MTARAVFLDRDGVLNRAIVRAGKPYPPAGLADLQIYPEAAAALASLRTAGFALIAVTNQPDVARGTARRETVEAINRQIQMVLGLDAILTCFHDDGDDCLCRKPRPGLLFQMREDRGIDLAASYMVGDRWRDVEAGRNAGCTTVFIDRGYQERRPIDLADHVCGCIAEAGRWICSRELLHEVP